MAKLQLLFASIRFINISLKLYSMYLLLAFILTLVAVASSGNPGLHSYMQYNIAFNLNFA
jgi:hypothetical protein